MNSICEYMPCNFCGVEFLPILGRRCGCLDRAPISRVEWGESEDGMPCVDYEYAGRKVSLSSIAGDWLDDGHPYFVELWVSGKRMRVSRNGARHLHRLLGELLDKLEQIPRPDDASTSPSPVPRSEGKETDL